ncbi:hypothetical protein D9758_015641 [Tetrapyrgos nigripes]|uniref:Uncharacterized protein n=1 Tax=Tetrapyrgos nigripes TaxID=182062 RepID=A0A8H5CM88_9AGAR|nr:hypothetical protein D9758_015641 [Tetrapyrgos nigripes]
MAVFPRQQSDAPTSASATSTPTNPTPFFPDPSARIHPDGGRSSELPKTVLEWVFVILFILLGLGFILYRANQLKLANRPLREFFHRRRRSSSHSHPAIPISYANLHTRSGPYDSTHFSNLTLANVPSSYQLSQLGRPAEARTRTRTRGVNTDSGGRRLDSRPPNEHGEGWDEEKDVLPAYDRHGGPPGYMESGIGTAGGGGVGMIRVGQALGLLHASFSGVSEDHDRAGVTSTTTTATRRDVPDSNSTVNPDTDTFSNPNPNGSDSGTTYPPNPSSVSRGVNPDSGSVSQSHPHLHPQPQAPVQT